MWQADKTIALFYYFATTSLLLFVFRQPVLARQNMSRKTRNQNHPPEPEISSRANSELGKSFTLPSAPRAALHVFLISVSLSLRHTSPPLSLPKNYFYSFSKALLSLMAFPSLFNLYTSMHLFKLLSLVQGSSCFLYALPPLFFFFNVIY